jgi:hypothetical protein
MTDRTVYGLVEADEQDRLVRASAEYRADADRQARESFARRKADFERRKVAIESAIPTRNTAY